MPYPPSSTAFETYKAGGSPEDVRMLVQMVLLVRGFRNKMDEELRRIGQSAARMETLSAILNMPGDKSQTDVARRLRIEGATVTRMVDILSKEGLVERRPAPNDRRVNLLSITPAGVEVVKAIFTEYDRVREHILQDISPEEIDQLYTLIGKMMRRLEEPLSSAVTIADMPRLDRKNDKLRQP